MNYICPDCGARLDPGELCDCKEIPPADAGASASGKLGDMVEPVTLNIQQNGGICQ